MLFGTVRGLFLLGSRDEQWSLRLTGKDRRRLAFLGALNVICIAGMSTGMNTDVENLAEIVFWKSALWGKIWWSIFAGCLLAAAVMDWWERMVYRFVWLAAGAAAGLLLCGKICDGTVWLHLIIYVVLQELFFARFYGRADCHAFCVCAAMLTVLGMSFRDYLIHMALVFGSLTLIQGMRGNITKNGQLRSPVPLVPYIVAAFWFLVDFTARKWYI